MSDSSERGPSRGDPSGDTLSERTVRRAFLGLGALLLVVALLPELGNLPEVQIGRSQGVLLTISLLAMTAGMLGNKRVAAYRGTALVVLNTIVALAFVEVGATAVEMVLGSDEGPAAVEFEVARANPYFADKPWADAFWEEEKASMGPERYHPYVIWRAAPFRGTHIQIDRDGLRHTPGSACGEDSYRVVLFGSSALWGWGVPDDGTIGAFLQSKLLDRSRPVCVQNRAQNGFVSTQDVIELVRLLQSGDRIDLAVFFNGFNDASALFETGDPGAHYMVDEVSAKFEGGEQSSAVRSALAGTATGRLLRRVATRGAPPAAPRWSLDEEDVPERSRQALHAYLTNYEAVRGLAEREGFAFAFFWQPYADWGRSADQAAAVPGAGSFDGRESLIKATYEAVRDTAGVYPELHFLADSLVQADPTVWLDYVHLAPAGNERVADLILGVAVDALPAR